MMWELDHEEAWAPRNDVFKLWCRRRLLRVLWTVRRSNQSILKKSTWIFIGRNDADAEADAPILWPPDGKSPLIGKDPDAGKDWKQEKRAKENESTDSMDTSLSKLQEIMEDRGAWRTAVHRLAENQTWLSDWTTGDLTWLSTTFLNLAYVPGSVPASAHWERQKSDLSSQSFCSNGRFRNKKINNELKNIADMLTAMKETHRAETCMRWGWA